MLSATGHTATDADKQSHPVNGSATSTDLVVGGDYTPNKPLTIPLNKIYVRVGRDKIYFGRGGELKKGGLIREKLPPNEYGPQRDPTQRLPWAMEQAANFKQHLFDEASHLVEDENGEYDDTDGGGRALIAHIKGFLTIEAFVSKNLSPKARAQRFREHQLSRVPLGAVQMFLTFVAEGCKREVAILNALKPNYIVAKNGTDAINSTKALYTVFDHGGAELLSRTAQICATAWKPKYKAEKGGRKKVIKRGWHVDGVVFVAVALVLACLPAKYDEEKLRKVLADATFKGADKNGQPKIMAGPEALTARIDSEMTMIAAKSKAPIKDRAKLLTQLKAVPVAQLIARLYDKGLDDKFAEINTDRIDEHPIAVEFAKLR